MGFGGGGGRFLRRGTGRGGGGASRLASRHRPPFAPPPWPSLHGPAPTKRKRLERNRPPWIFAASSSVGDPRDGSSAWRPAPADRDLLDPVRAQAASLIPRPEGGEVVKKAASFNVL